VGDVALQGCDGDEVRGRESLDGGHTNGQGVLFFPVSAERESKAYNDRGNPQDDSQQYLEFVVVFLNTNKKIILYE